MTYEDFLKLEAYERDAIIIKYMRDCEFTEHYYYLSDVYEKDKKELMYDLMREFCYFKFIPKTLQDVIKLENFEL